MAHPVPQNVTQFEFHLIGNMTVRQFCYLAAGLIIAYVIFLMFASILPYIAYPLIFLSASVGAAFAFLPIMERPLDYWMASFIKAITKPTVRKYQSTKVMPQDETFKKRVDLYIDYVLSQKKPNSPIANPHSPAGGPIIDNPQPKVAVVAPAATNIPILQTTPQVQPVVAPTPIPTGFATPQPQTQTSAFPATSSISFPQIPKPIASPNTPPQQKEIPTKEDLEKTIELAKEAQVVKTQILQTEKQLETIKLQAAQPGADPNQYTGEFQEILTNLNDLNEQARKVSREMAEVQKEQTPAQLQRTQAPIKPNIIPTLTLTQIPNIINGIVTDSQGSYLEGAIVVAHDKQGLPVRALKTNKLGQFVAATPLDNGTYTLNIEKENLLFDVIEVELKGEVINPVVVSAKN